MPFPLIKLGSLLVKQLSKPLANAVKRRSKQSPFFQKVCMKPAQWYHWVEVNVKMNILGLKAKSVTPMSPEMAAELGAEMIGEAFLYSFFAGLIYAEYAYSSIAAEKKEEEKKQYLLGLQRQIDELAVNTERQEAQLRELHREMADLDYRNRSLTDKLFGRAKTKS